MISKIIKYHPIVVSAYDKWLVSKSDMRDSLKAKKLAGKLNDCVDKLSATLSSTTNITS